MTFGVLEAENLTDALVKTFERLVDEGKLDDLERVAVEHFGAEAFKALRLFYAGVRVELLAALMMAGARSSDRDAVLCDSIRLARKLAELVDEERSDRHER